MYLIATKQGWFLESANDSFRAMLTRKKDEAYALRGKVEAVKELWRAREMLPELELERVVEI